MLGTFFFFSFFFLFFFFFRHRAPATVLKLFSAFLPLLFPSSSDGRWFVLPTGARLATDRGEIVGESRLQRFFLFSFRGAKFA